LVIDKPDTDDDHDDDGAMFWCMALRDRRTKAARASEARAKTGYSTYAAEKGSSN
jgi:hypothetical protein